MKKLFQYAVVFHKFETNEKNDKIYKDSELIIEPKFALALNEKELMFKATREISDEYAKFSDNVEIIIRNF